MHKLQKKKKLCINCSEVYALITMKFMPANIVASVACPVLKVAHPAGWWYQRDVGCGLVGGHL
jgi:hypothetical protein